MIHYIENTHFNTLYKLISSSSVKFLEKQLQNPTSNETEIRDKIVYNGYSEDAFYKELKSAYYGASGELEKNSSHFSSKSEYIFYLKSKQRMLIDAIEDNFDVQSTGIIKHLNFKIDIGNSDDVISKSKKDDNLCIPFIQAQYKYAKRAEALVSDFIQTIMNLNSEDISLKTPEQIKSDTATSERPLAFFENFYLRGGLWRYRKSFEPTEDDYLYTNISYDEKEETKTTHEQNPETGEYEPYTEHFKKDIIKKLNEEYWKFVDAIDTKIDSLSKSKDEISNFLILQISRIKQINAGIIKSEFALKYESSRIAPVKLIKHIADKYKHYIPVDVLYDVRDIYEIEYSAPFQKLTLNIPSKNFVQIFGDLIKNQKLQQNGTSDVQPIVETLAAFFNIPKTRGKGFIQVSSLQTEFKEFMAPPLKAKSRK